jgi:hypothetical protein
MDHIDDGDRHDAGIVRLLTDVLLAVPRLVALLGLALLYYVAPAALFYVAPAALFAWGRATGASGTGGTGATSGRRISACLAGRWAAAWAVSIALVVAARTVGRGPVVGLLRWMERDAAALPTHPATFAQTTVDGTAALAIVVLTLVVFVVLAAPFIIPIVAAGHLVVSWLRRGTR